MSKFKILLILPDGRINKLKIGSFVDVSFREAPLTATYLAGLVPDVLNPEIEIVDESVGQRVDFSKQYDVVGISAMTGTAIRAYEIADKFRNHGTLVVLGGVHVTLLPQEAKAHADAIVIGFAENTWPQLLRDIVNDELKPQYQEFNASLASAVIPKRELQKTLGYMTPNTVLMTRGCQGRCDFCSIPAANYGWATRPIEEIISEIKSLECKRIGIGDVHLTEDVEYAKQLFRAMIPLKVKWGALASTRIAADDELLDLMYQSGCRFLLIGFESTNNNSLCEINKGFNQVDQYRELIKKLHARNIVVQGCFIFGFDHDTKSVFKDTVDFINDIHIDIPRFAIYTPYPKTKLYNRLESENRILHKNWYYYDTQHVVIKPKNMSATELDDGFKWAYNETFKISNNIYRSISSGINFPITFMGNLAYKLYIKKLNSDKDRFPKKVGV